MPNAKLSNENSFKIRERVSFSKIPTAMEPPNLIDVQRQSFAEFMTNGLTEVFANRQPIENVAGTMEVSFGEHLFGEPPHTVQECKAKDMTYQAPLLVNVRFLNKETGEMEEQLVFMGDFPMMTNRGTFIINGSERVVVSQVVKSPGVFFLEDVEDGVQTYSAQFNFERGDKLSFQIDKRGQFLFSVGMKRKVSAVLFLRALGVAESDEEFLELFDNNDIIRRELDRCSAQTKEDALIEFFSRLSNEPPTIDAAKSLIDNIFNPNKSDLTIVGRFMINKRLGTHVDEECNALTPEDVLAAIKYLLALADGDPTKKADDIDHFGNRRIRTVGELVQNQLSQAMRRLDRNVRERMASQDADSISPQSLINIRPIVAAIKEFFGSSQMSQFMDQSNPLAGLTNKRRVTALGPGGLAGHKAGGSKRTNVPASVRDVHNSHYSRMCPIETPEGPNIGLIGSFALYARVNSLGFVEAPYRRVVDGVVTDQIDWLTADQEEHHIIAPANIPVDPKTNRFIEVDFETGELFEPESIIARTRDFDGSFGAPDMVPVADVDYMDVSPRQFLSCAASLIPFLEHDDAKRTLMGANMQRQAVPLLRVNAPYVGTGIEYRAALDSGDLIVAHEDGVVVAVDAAKVVVKDAEGTETYPLPKFERSNQSTCINHRPIVKVGQKVRKGQPLADGTSVDQSELALGTNLTVAYMPWEGYNYEDGIVISERVVQEDLLTSINITRHEIDARDTKLGKEEITREIPNLSEEARSNLDEDGIIRIGAEVGPGDVLVGKVTPKGEQAPSAEERLLRAIFGAKANDVRDTSLRMDHGAYGRVVDIVRFKRDEGDDLPPGVNELVRVFVAQRRKIQEGDKLSGRHGNKGVICRVLPVEDMPYMSDGTPVDVVLDPLGVPSRMNVGQLLETHLGWAAAHGWDTESDHSEKFVEGPFYVSTPVFDGATDVEVADVLRRSNINVMNKALKRTNGNVKKEFVTQVNEMGKTTLYDGRTGEPFRDPITVGVSYILKLGHMVDDKIHARSTGPYSLVTQQPLGGKAQFGGQRFGEMEVWALYAYGAANVLQEILTVKSDDTNGRVKTYEAIVKGANIPEGSTPESFKVLVREIRSLAISIDPLKRKSPEKEDVQQTSALDAVDTFTADTTEELLGTSMSAKADGATEVMLGGTTDKE